MSAQWNSFNKPKVIAAWDNWSEFEYSVDGRRTKQIITENLTNITKKVYATPAYEMKEVLLNPAETNRANWQWSMDYCRIYVDTPAGKIGIYQQQGSTNGVGDVTRSYIHKDHLGSVIATSDSSANITYYSYDAWGNRRDPDDWSSTSTFNASTLSTDRGYTGHEMLDHLDLIHMNGRIYDPVIGRMISPDPIIQAPNNLQSFNRYSYVWNNPLSYNDPSGFVTAGLELILGSARSSGGGGGAGGGGSSMYFEPITTVYKTDCEGVWDGWDLIETWTEWWDSEGNYYCDVTYDVVDPSTYTSVASYNSNVASKYAAKNPATDGVTANEGSLSTAVKQGRNETSEDPVAKATKGGTDNPAAESKSKAHTDGKKQQLLDSIEFTVYEWKRGEKNLSNLYQGSLGKNGTPVSNGGTIARDSMISVKVGPKLGAPINAFPKITRNTSGTYIWAGGTFDSVHKDGNSIRPVTLHGNGNVVSTTGGGATAFSYGDWNKGSMFDGHQVGLKPGSTVSVQFYYNTYSTTEPIYEVNLNVQ